MIATREFVNKKFAAAPSQNEFLYFLLPEEDLIGTASMRFIWMNASTYDKSSAAKLSSNGVTRRKHLRNY
ncbi:MAG: hypothetical protein WKF89_16320 [Chitinophagaceae bacterium]